MLCYVINLHYTGLIDLLKYANHNFQIDANTVCSRRLFCIQTHIAFIIQVGQLPYIQNDDCKKSVDTWNEARPTLQLNITDNMICVGFQVTYIGSNKTIYVLELPVSVKEAEY